MATIALNANQINQMPALIREIKQSVIDYKTELASLSNRIRTIDTAVVNLDEVVASIQSSTLTQEEKIASLDTFEQNLEDFVTDVVRIDNEVATIINQNKTGFYATYSYLKPFFEKNLWEDICDGMFAVGKWCQDHWVELLVGIACIAIGAFLTLLTGGAFLPAFLAGLKMALVAGLMSGGINALLSIGGSLIKGESGDVILRNALNAFGNGFASGFMFGGIMAGASMSISAGFRFASNLPGVSAGPGSGIGPKWLKILSPDHYSPTGGGTLFKAGNTFRVDVDIRILIGKKYINPFGLANYLHMHLPGISRNIPGLLVVGGHIPIALYISVALGVFNSKE